MRISDWSSDVCSSDLRPIHRRFPTEPTRATFLRQPAGAPANFCSPSARYHGDEDEGQAAPPLPLCTQQWPGIAFPEGQRPPPLHPRSGAPRSEEHTSELHSLMRISYAVFCLKKKKTTHTNHYIQHYT